MGEAVSDTRGVFFALYLLSSSKLFSTFSIDLLSSYIPPSCNCSSDIWPLLTFNFIDRFPPRRRFKPTSFLWHTSPPRRLLETSMTNPTASTEQVAYYRHDTERNPSHDHLRDPCSLCSHSSESDHTQTTTVRTRTPMATRPKVRHWLRRGPQISGAGTCGLEDTSGARPVRGWARRGRPYA